MPTKSPAVGGPASEAKPPQALEIPTREEVLKRNSIERLKQERAPYDILEHLPRLIETGYEAIPEEDIVRLQWWGLYHDKPKTGFFMLRVKIAGGLLQPAQLRAIGELSTRYGRDHGEITTRQCIQLHSLRLEDLPAVLEALTRAGLTTAGGCGDVVRNVTCCPVAGLDRGEVFDVRPVLDTVARHFYGNRAFSDLPRKHKYTITACPHRCTPPEIHCVGLIAAVHGGREGFAVTVGGGLSAQPRLARDMGVFVPRDEAVSVLEAITGSWMDNLRYRRSRAKARFKFMVDDYGADGIRAMVEERLGRTLASFPAPTSAVDGDHLGIHPQRQEGLSYVGFPVRLGWITGTQMQALAGVVEDIGGDVRLTGQQNFIVANVPDARVDELVRRVEQIGFSLETHRLYGRSIGCTGEPFCNYAVTQTKDKLAEILDALVARFGDRVRELRIHLDGCPHACAQHFTGDINLTGTTVRLPDRKKMDGYDVLLRGGIGPKAAIARPVLRRVRADEVIATLERLVAAWIAAADAARATGEELTFRDFCDARTDEELQAIAGLGGGGTGDEA